MAGDGAPPPRSPLVVAFGLIAAAALLAWLFAGFVGCKHAGLI